MRLIYLSHPEVHIDPMVPVPDWGLSEIGRARVLAAKGWPKVTRVVSSDERKARETAEILAGALGLSAGVHAGLAEIDRSATGYVPHEQHEALANQLFSEPHTSASGWETAYSAQQRAVSALQDVLAEGDDVLVVGHGGVGTLSWCHFAGKSIARKYDQPCGGCVWEAFGPAFEPKSGWRRLEDVLTKA